MAASVIDLPGLTPRRCLALGEAFGTEARLADLLTTLPQAIDDLAPMQPSEAPPDRAVAFTFEATDRPRPLGRTGRRLDGRSGGDAVTLRWFRAPAFGIVERLAAGGPHVLQARLRPDEREPGRFCADHPRPVAAARIG
ncbi:MAG: hypothetical protein ACOCYE_12470, partial [Pseudomonadota bacterium]